MTPEIKLMQQSARSLSILSQLFGTRMARLLEPHGLTQAQFGVLNHIARPDLREGTRISDIAAAVELNQPAVTKTIAKFESMGLATLKPAPADQRAKIVQITEQGGGALMQIQREIGPALAGLFQAVPKEELETFVETSAKLIAWLDTNRL